MTTSVSDRPTGTLQSVQRAASAFGNAYLFAGRRLDDRTGLYYNRHRYYEPRSGRFVSRDPYGYVEGMNPYAYTRNSPVNGVDPLGLITANVTIAPRWQAWTKPRRIKIGDVLRGPVRGVTVVNPKKVSVAGSKGARTANVVILGAQCRLVTCPTNKNCDQAVSQSISIRFSPDIAYVDRRAAVHEAVHARQIADLIREKLKDLNVRTLCGKYADQGPKNPLRKSCRTTVIQKAKTRIAAALREWNKKNVSIHALNAGRNDRNPDRRYRDNPVEREARERSSGANPAFPEGVQPPGAFQSR